MRNLSDRIIRTLLILTLLLSSLLAAQIPQTNTAPALSLQVEPQQVKFTVQRAVVSYRFQVQNQNGELVFDSGSVSEAEFLWSLRNSSNEALASGLYQYTLTIQEKADEAAKVQRGHFIIERASDREADRVWVTTQDSQGVSVTGTQVTAARNGQELTAGARGERQTSPVTRDSSGRTVAETASAKKTPGDKDAINSGSTGTANRLARWITSQDLGDSTIQEVSGRLGFGSAPDAAAPFLFNGEASSTLPQQRPALLLQSAYVNATTPYDHARVEMRSIGPALLHAPILQGRAASGTASAPAATPINQIMGGFGGGGHDGTQFTANSGGFVGVRAAEAWTPTAQGTYLTFETTANGTPATTRAERLRIAESGNIGIGTTTPGAKLDVAGAINSALQYNLGGLRVLSNPGTNNLFAGVDAGASNTTGRFNSFFGSRAGNSNADGYGNSFFGESAGFSNASGLYNTFSGMEAGLFNTTGSENTYVGAAAGSGTVAGSNATQNTFIGKEAGKATVGGIQICATCGPGGTEVYQGSHNLFAGYKAGYSNTTGRYNTFNGYATGYTNTIGVANTFSGYAAGYANTSGSNNTFSGGRAGASNTLGSNNTFSGNRAGDYNTEGSYNTFSGAEAGFYNTTGLSNTFSGYQSGHHNTTGSRNTYVGEAAGYGADTGSTGYGNTFIGTETGYSNTTGSGNTFSGRAAGHSNTTGDQNTFSGVRAGYRNTSGGANTFSGVEAGYYNTTGFHNVFMGFLAGNFNTTGTKNTAIGTFADVGSDYTNATAIGYNSKAYCSDCIVLGTFTTNVGIGTVAPNPSYMLHVGGPILAAAFVPSDARYKRDIKGLPHALAQVMRLRGVSYDYNRAAFPELNFAKGRQVGFVAQEVEQVLPEVVNKDHEGYYALNYSAVVPLLTEAIKEQQQQAEQKDARIKTLEQQNLSQQQLLSALQKRLATVERAIVRQARKHK